MAVSSTRNNREGEVMVSISLSSKDQYSKATISSNNDFLGSYMQIYIIMQ